MSFKCLAVFIFLLSGTARADLNFTFVDGADNGVENVLVAHKQAAIAAGTNGWLWGALVWSDPSGSYAYFNYHKYGTGFLFKRNPDGSYTDISPPEPNSTNQRPKENRPILMDADNNGFIDILHTGDETTNSASLMNYDGVWQFSRPHRLGWKSAVKDVNGDGYLDVYGNTSAQTYGKGVVRTLTNLSGTGFARSETPFVLPEGCPQEVVDRVNASTARYHFPRVYDLDESTYIVTYGGSYNGPKFTYVVRNNQVVNIGLPAAGTAHAPEDVDGDGDLDVVIQWSTSAGVYRQAAGVFARDVAGYMPTINTALRTGAYMWDVWPIDLDQDGDNDLVMSNKRSGKGWILDNQAGTFRLYKAFSHVDGEPVWPGDADGDGDIDIVYAGGTAQNGDQAGFFINQSEGENSSNFKSGSIPFPDHDKGSAAWKKWTDSAVTGAANLALLGRCSEAIPKAQAIVTTDNVSGDQYLQSGGQFNNVFSVLSWCEVPQAQGQEWADWGKRHLGEPDGSVTNSIWWKDRWSRNNPANNYYHSFVLATTTYAMATMDKKWLDWLKADRLPKMTNYYATTPEGGSREGTGYGESHRNVFTIARLWREYDGTEVLPQPFIDNSIRYWTHATAPGHKWVALIGDHTRTHGTTDSYHRDIIDNAMHLAKDPEAIAIGKWQINRLPPLSASFYGLVLRDYPDDGHPPAETEYHAKGAGHFFARDSWTPDATYLVFTAGKKDEAHQQEDQGAFAVWARKRWQTTSESPWTQGGIAQDVAYQNVVRFPSATNIKGQSGTLVWSKSGNLLTVDMDLTAVAGEPWTRNVQWSPGWEALRITDKFTNADATFGFETPGKGETAEVITQRSTDGFRSVVAW